jgi:hypothetical protein
MRSRGNKWEAEGRERNRQGAGGIYGEQREERE